jgi:hypothetical protein
VNGQLTRLSAICGNDVDVIVAGAIGRKRDPLSIRRKARINFASFVVRDALHSGAIFVGDPDVAQVAERNFAVGIRGITQEARLRLCGA